MTEPVHGLEHGLTNYGDRDFSLYLRRSFAQSMGYSRAMLEKPVVGIAYTPSGFNNCHRHFPELLDAVKRGVLAAGALPIDFPTISLGEVFLSPTSLKYRNLMSIDTEEMVRAQPMDAVVLMGGCDKTVPAQLMGAISAERPAIMLVAGPMMTGRHRGERRGGREAHRLGTDSEYHRQCEVGGECAAGSARARRLDQCGDPSHRHRRPRRGQGFARRAQRAVRCDTGAGQSQTGGQWLHGGFFCRRRNGRPAARAQAAPSPRLHDRDRRDA